MILESTCAFLSMQLSIIHSFVDVEVVSTFLACWTSSVDFDLLFTVCLWGEVDCKETPHRQRKIQHFKISTSANKPFSASSAGLNHLLIHDLAVSSD